MGGEEVESQPGFESALELAKRQGRLPALPPSAPADLVIAPEIPLEKAIELWTAADKIRASIMSNPACYDEIDGRKELNRTGLTRLAVPFGLPIEARSFDEGRIQDAETGDYDYRYRIQVRVSKGSRFVDGVGSCRVSEIPEPKNGKMEPGKKEHFALAKAWTRAAKRAIADILGGTEAD